MVASNSYTEPPTNLTRPTLRGHFGMAASTHWLASGVAQAVLERGGNAFDAGVAAGFVLHIAEPHLNGPGGDMIAICAPTGAAPEVIVGQGPAPLQASIERYRAEGLDAVPGAGALAAAVPGAVEAWLWLLKERGTWDVTGVLQYAIDYATVGQPIVPRLADTIAGLAAHFSEHWPSSAAQWMPGGKPPKPGAILGNPTYGRTLRRLLDYAGTGSREERIDRVIRQWKTGFVAREIVEFAAIPHWHSSGRAHAGLLTMDDFAAFNVVSEPSLTLNFRGHVIAKSSFWSQSPVLLQSLSILDQFDPPDLDPSTARGAHTIIETIKLAMADRDAYYGDVLGNHELLRVLLSPEYCERRASLISPHASGDFRPGPIPGVVPYTPPLDRDVATSGVSAGEPTVRPSAIRSGDTVHLDVVDRWGNLLSATPSGGWLQSNPTIPALGFCLGTRLQMTWLDERSPSALVPRRRPRTTLSPTLMLRDGVAVSALGTPGGDQQDQWQLLYLLRVIVGGYTPQQAIDSPMFHTTAVVQSFWPRAWTSCGVVVEDRLGTTVIEELRQRGHDISLAGPWNLGRLSSVSYDPGTGTLSAAANSRGEQGYAVGR